MVRYEDFRRRYAYLYDCDVFGLRKVKHVYGGIWPESPDHGRIVLMRFGLWDTETVPPEDVLRCALFTNEVTLMQPKIQILGITIVVDLSGLSVRHVAKVTPTIAGQVVSLMGVSFPLIVHGVHIVNYNWMLHSVFYLFKRFVPTAVWSRIHFHESDLNSLHRQIDPKHLPSELGGHCTYYISLEEWIGKIELRELGFQVRNKRKEKKAAHFGRLNAIKRQ